MIRGILNCSGQKLRARKFRPVATIRPLFLRAPPHSRVRGARSGSSPYFSTGARRESYLLQYHLPPSDEVRCSCRPDLALANRFPVARARGEAPDSERSALRRYSRTRRGEAGNFRLTENFE